MKAEIRIGTIESMWKYRMKIYFQEASMRLEINETTIPERHIISMKIDLKIKSFPRSVNM
jgi:hypothetical protein